MSYSLTVGKNSKNIVVNDGENILDAITLAHIRAPHSCCNGNCMICEARLLSGSVSQSYRDDSRQEKFLACKSTAFSDCHLQFLHKQYLEESHRLACRVLNIEAEGDNAWRLILLIPAGKHPPIDAGSIELLSGNKRYTTRGARLIHRNLSLRTNRDPILYVDQGLAYIHYQSP